MAFHPGLKKFFNNDEELLALLESSNYWSREIEGTRKSHEKYDASISISCIRNQMEAPEGFVIIFRDITELRKAISALEILARIDGLTGLYNRRYFLERVTQELKRAKRHYQPLTICLLDLDHFKHINDSYGHQVGDLVLSSVSQEIQQLVRGTDLIGRYGGEEICIALPLTGNDGGKELAERIRVQIASLSFKAPRDGAFQITCSIGLATLQANDTIESLLKHADDCLYQAKQAGRNQVCSFTT